MLLPSDIDLVNFSSAVYNPQPNGYWDVLDPGPDDNIYWSLKKTAGFDIITFRGSITAHDWLDDIRAIPYVTRIGTVHKGFYDGMEHMWNDVKKSITQPACVTGHSLGAARADILAGLMTVDGMPPVKLSVFGEPKPGFEDFGKLINSIPGTSYRNGNATFKDIVTEVPITLRPFDAFVHRKKLVDVDAEPMPNTLDDLSVFAFHHIELYVAAVTDYVKSQESHQ
jgi:hypothetical protein